jgi:murein DD-endopeptidase MepM/ murein hydrolase activator NlpD
MRFPLASNVIRRRSERNTFGLVRKNGDGTDRPHQGWDFEARVGTPCFAIADGAVVAIADQGDYGKQLTIRLFTPHEGKYIWAFYAHLLSIDVVLGQDVTEGQQVGRTGESGNAAGMPVEDQHLHFEIRTAASVGRGLTGRISPLKVFGSCPLHAAVTA